MGFIPGPIDEAVMYGPKILAGAKKIISFAGKHKALTATAALMADANFNNGKIIGGTFNAVGNALGNTVSTVASGAANGVGTMVDSALGGEGGGLLKAVGIGGGVLAAAPLVMSAISTIGGLFNRRKKRQPGQAGGGGANAAMMQQQMMMQQMMVQQLMMQQHGGDKKSDASNSDVASLKAELAGLKAVNSGKPVVRPSPVTQSSAKDMTASREFTEGPTKVVQSRSLTPKASSSARPSQKPAEHSMTQKESKKEETGVKEKPVSPVTKTKPPVEKRHSTVSSTNITINSLSAVPSSAKDKEVDKKGNKNKK